MTYLYFFKNYLKKFFYLFLLSFFHISIVFAESELPKCKGEDYTKWKNCFGTYLNKEISEIDSEHKWTRDYTGEFGSVAGKREGEGSSISYKNGKLYQTFVGEFINDKTEGFGVTTFADGFEYVGEFKEGQRHGQGTFTTNDGDKYVGKFKDGKLSGIIVITYNNGSEYIGEFNESKKNGQGTLTYYNGEKYAGEWKDDFYHGVGTYIYADGQKYIGEWKKNNWDGQGTVLTADGRKYVGGWKNNKKHGQGTFTWPNGEKYVGEWKDDFYHGQGSYTYSDGAKYVGEWKNNKAHGQGIYTYPDGTKKAGEWKDGDLTTSKSKKKSLKKDDVDIKKERKKLEEELKKLQEEKNKAKQTADKQKKLENEKNKYFAEAYDFENPANFEYAQQFIIYLQEFIKENPEEFDILEITELIIKNKNVLEGLWNDEDKQSFNSLFEYVKKSNIFSTYIDNKFYERIEKKVNEYNFEVKNVEENIVFLKKYLQDNLTSKAAEKVVIHIRKTEKVFNNPTLENLKKVNKETNQLIKSLNNSKNIKNTKIRKNATKNKPIIKGSSKEKIINILKELDFNYRDIEFSRNEEDFVIYNLEIDNQKIEKVEVEGLNKIYLEGIFKFLIKGEKTDYFNSYNGKYFDKIKVSGISNFIIGEYDVSGKEIGITDLDFKKFDIIKKLINSAKYISEEDKNIISYMMSMSFNNFYFEDIIIKNEVKNSKTQYLETFKYGYVEISGFKDLAINKFLIKNASFQDKSDKVSVENILLEKLILDEAEILTFLNSNDSDNVSFLSNDYFSYIQNGMQSLRKFEINKFSAKVRDEKILDFSSFEFNNINFDYFGNNRDKKIPISFEFNVDEADFSFNDRFVYRDIADRLKYDAIKFDFGGEWNWNTRRNNLSINLDLGITDGASITFKSSFTDLSTDVLNLTGAPLGTYLMTQPKIKKLNLSLEDNSLKNRLIDFFAKEENMNSEQYKDFIAQSFKIFLVTIGATNTLVEDIEEAVINFIYDSDNIKLSIKPSQPLSITDLMPDFKEPDPNKIIKTLNLKISNSLF